MTRKRSRSAAGVFLLALWLGAGCAGRDSDVVPPNVLLITLDTTRADRLGSYGHDRHTSPNLDALAADGILFEFAISTSASTPPAHASILTGLYPQRHGVRVIHAGSGYRLPATIPTLASVLADRGFETGAFLSSFTVSGHYGFDRGFDVFDEGLPGSADAVLRELPGGAAVWNVAENQRRSDTTSEAAIRWLRDRQRPFFAWLHYWDPHDAGLLPPPEIRERFAREVSPSNGNRATYDSEVFYMDSQLGRVLDLLRELGIYDQTVVVAVADHGEGLGDHDWMGHRLLYQEQIRVPLILRIPGGPAGVRVPALVRTTDLYPTVLELVAIEPPQPVDGRSFLGLIGGRPEPPRLAYADQLNAWDTNSSITHARPLDALLYAVTDRSWKLIYRDRAPARSELFHLAQDPTETRNLFRPDHPQYRRLKAALDDFDGYRRVPFPAHPEGGAHPGVRERLRSLGYLDE